MVAVSGCAPTYDPPVTDRLASARVAVTDLAGQCPTIDRDELRAMVRDLDVAAEMVRYRPNAADVLDAIGRVRGMAATVPVGAMSVAYCRQKMWDLGDGLGAVLRGYEGL